MKTPFILCLIFLFGTSIIHAQSVSGTVVDEQGNAVPYATIQLGERYGVISNTGGEFTLSMPEDASGAITISCLGYESLEIPLSEFRGRIYVLEEKVTELDEVLVSNKLLSAREIVEKMLTVAPELHTAGDRSEVFFMRNQENQKLLNFIFEIDKASKTSRSDLKTLNAEIGELTGSIVGSRFKFFTEYYGRYLQYGDSSKLKVEKGVILKDKDRDISAEEITKKLINTVRPYLDKDATYKVKTGIIKVEDSLSTGEIFEEDIDSVKGKTRNVKGILRWRLKAHNAFYQEEDLDFLQKMNRYSYTIEGYANIDGETVYIIGFLPERGSAQFSGKMYINAFDFGMMRLEYKMLEGERLHNVNLKMLLGVKYTEDRVEVTSEYRKNEAGKYYLKFGSKRSGTYAYISRPLKFIKNREDRSEDRQVFKMDFTFELDNVSTSEIYIVENKALTPQGYVDFGQQDSFEPLELGVYDESIWKGYNIIAPIEEIRTYGKEGAR